MAGTGVGSVRAARADIGRAGTAGQDKLAYRVAQRIAADILARGWVVGEKLGTEAELLERFGVSREPFREAIQILERQGVVVTGRGPRGGVTIQAPALDAVSNVIKTYFEFADVSFAEVMEAQEILQLYALELAAQRMTPAHANDIRRVLDKPRPQFRSRDQEGRAVFDIYEAINRVAGNPSLSMLIFTLSRTVADFGHQERYPKALWASMIGQTWQTVERMARCAMRGDGEGATRALLKENALVARVVRDLARQNERIWNTRSYLQGHLGSATQAHPGRDKAAVGLAYRITAHIRRSDLVPGTVLGTEPELMGRFSSSRAMFRAAVRVMEFFGVVTVRRGIEGGLTVTEPNGEPTIQTAVLYLRYFRPDDADFVALLRRIQREVALRAAQRAAHSDILRLLEGFDALQATGREGLRAAAADIHRAIVGLTENRALALITEIVVSTRIAVLTGLPSAALVERVCKCAASAAQVLQQALDSKEAAALEPTLQEMLDALCLAFES